MSRKNQSPEEKARRAKIRELLQMVLFSHFGESEERHGFIRRVQSIYQIRTV